MYIICSILILKGEEEEKSNFKCFSHFFFHNSIDALEIVEAMYYSLTDSTTGRDNLIGKHTFQAQLTFLIHLVYPGLFYKHLHHSLIIADLQINQFLTVQQKKSG